VKVFLDANVLFSASNAGSRIAELVRLLLDRRQLVTSNLAAEEARRNIQQKRPAWADGLDAVLSRIEIVPAVNTPLSVRLDPKDVHILSTAIREKCTHLATGDKTDFAHLYGKTIAGVMVITLLQLAELAAI
jgi:predicted nucleic acid-binding protein